MTERHLTLIMFVSNALLGVALVSLVFKQETAMIWSLGLWVVSLLGLGQIDHAMALKQRRARSEHPGPEGLKTMTWRCRRPCQADGRGLHGPHQSWAPWSRSTPS